MSRWWPLQAFTRTSLPLPVVPKRFDAPLWLLIFGILVRLLQISRLPARVPALALPPRPALAEPRELLASAALSPLPRSLRPGLLRRALRFSVCGSRSLPATSACLPAAAVARPFRVPRLVPRSGQGG